MSAPARPAVLQAAVETETAEGGRTRVWADAAAVWVALSYGGASDDAAQEMRPARVETAAGAARDHPAAAVGLQLLVDGDTLAWRVRAVRRDEPRRGWMTLALDREAG